MNDDRFEEPTLPAETVVRRLTPKLRYAALGLAGLTVAVLVGTLWATEPALPARTHVAFGGVVAMGLGWAVFAAWALTRAPLFARDRVVAATLALGFSAVTAIGLAITAKITGVAVGLVLVAAAGVLLVNARRTRADLLRRKEELENG
ncbi:hypothetical protein Lesp02_11890 [Lentzea sp. NBRC 105346]|uniref:hypothetical protein n=1 Tax=Lentzea sp. NBRC 105346 TaxID=3032205 RepID=UPI0024A522F9|nr:hypothetical protein [Lentzea sp. NBRC 105346]GLZ28999.1 hypothetical protein Lesp02_11890 [Lentzea sp. NBRC 105346]